MSVRNICIIMCKAPELGKVKTRLAATVGDASALEIYTAMFQHILGNIHEAPCEILLCVEGDEGALPSTHYHRYAQRGDGLGERIVNAVVDAGQFDACVVIGTDAPFLDAHVLGNSFTQLESSDVVIGPSLDGGYYLIGFNVMNTTLFDRISWSSEHVLLQTIERCNELDLRMELLPPMVDVDTAGDVLLLDPFDQHHASIVTRLRSIIAMILVLMCCSAPLLADGGWIRKQGELFGKVSFQTLSTTSVYDLEGTKSTTPAYSLWSVGLFAEYGLVKDLMIGLNVPLYRSSAVENYGTVGGLGDMGLDVRYGIVGGDWPVSVGVGLELPTGDESAVIQSVGEPHWNVSDIHLPTGDGELNMWLNAGVSHSFWPTEAFVSFDAGYNVRALSVSDYTKQFDNGQFTDQYRLSLKGGYKPLDKLWVTLALYRFATAGTAKSGRFTFNGLGEGVEYNAWDLGLIYEFGALSISIDASSAFTTPKAIYGGMNIFGGVMVKL